MVGEVLVPLEPQINEERRRLAVAGDGVSGNEVWQGVERDDDREGEQAGEDGQAPAGTPSIGRSVVGDGGA